MSTSRNKTIKTKSNSHKKLRKSNREIEVQDNVDPPNRCDTGIQTMGDMKCSSNPSTKKTHRDSSVCKSLENIMHLNSGNHDGISMSKTDISIVYGMYKALVQKSNVSNDIHIDNYQSLINEFHKFQSQLYEQGQGYKSVVNVTSALISRHRIDQRMRRKEINKANKIMIMKLNAITSVIYKLQSSIESLDKKNLILESKIEESMSAVHQEVIQNKKKKSIFCNCM